MLNNDTKLENELAAAKSALKSAEVAIRDIYVWVDKNVVGTDVYPRQFPMELNQPFNVLHESLQNLEAFVRGIDNQNVPVFLKLIGGQHLSKEEFHQCCALGLLNYSNKSAGLSEYDDYEVFQHFVYESEDVHGYISPSMKPLGPPVTVDGTTTIQARFQMSSFPPEEIPWEKLNAGQRLFFERYLPDVAVRFSRNI